MKRKKIFFVLVVLLSFIGGGKMALFAFDNPKVTSNVVEESEEKIISKDRKELLELKESQNHILYISTPLGSIGIF